MLQKQAQEVKPLVHTGSKDPESQTVQKRGGIRVWVLGCLVVVLGFTLVITNADRLSSGALPSLRGRIGDYSGPGYPMPETHLGPGSANMLDQSSSTLDRKASLNLNDWRNGKYVFNFGSYKWVDGSNGEYLTTNSQKNLVLRRLGNNSSDVLVAKSNPNISGKDRKLGSKVKLNSDYSLALVPTDATTSELYTTLANVWILDVANQQYQPLYPGNEEALISVYSFNPDGTRVAFVYENDLYVRDLASDDLYRVTEDGDAHIYNGVADQVSRMDVRDDAFWWSGDGNFVFYTRINNTATPSFELEYFVQDKDLKFPQAEELKYLHPGSVYPLIDFYVYDVDQDCSNLIDVDITSKYLQDIIVGDNQAIVRAFSRDATSFDVYQVDAESAQADIIRKGGSPGQNGWYEQVYTGLLVPAGNGRADDGYIELMQVGEFYHLGYFSSFNATEPVMLTEGDWEVTDLRHFNPDTNTVLFGSTMESPIRNNYYSVNLNSPRNIEALTQNGSYSLDLSADASYAVVSYDGPSMPSTRVVELSTNRTLFQENFDSLREYFSENAPPTVTYSQVEVSPGVLVNVREFRPHDFNESNKYPVLFYNYGGPNSQEIQEAFQFDFQNVYAESNNAVVVTVDPRGTGHMGLKFRGAIRDQLGHLESHDVIEVAKQWNKKSYVDPSVTAIWGWSFGGYLTLKVLETDAGNEFKYGVSVAPVTDWSLYHSAYSSAYLNLPQENPQGYAESQIHNVENIAKSQGLLIMHGTGDDNVHIQNTYRLIDEFNQAGYNAYDVHIFPDSPHAIDFHNAQDILYAKLEAWLTERQFGKA